MSALLAGAEGEELQPVRARFEAARHRRCDAHDVERLQVVRLLLERDAPRAAEHDVELLLAFVPVAERLAEVRRKLLVAEPALLGVGGGAPEARLDVR